MVIARPVGLIAVVVTANAFTALSLNITARQLSNEFLEMIQKGRKKTISTIGGLG